MIFKSNSLKKANISVYLLGISFLRNELIINFIFTLNAFLVPYELFYFCFY